MKSSSIEVAEILGLAERARETHRLTKKHIIEQWEHSAPADARLLSLAISSSRIVAVLSPTTIDVPAVHDTERPVDMIPVVEVRAVGGVTPKEERRVAELLHRAMPRPSVIAMCTSAGAPMLSLALTRLSKTEAGMSVVEAHLVLPIRGIAEASLHVGDLDRADLGTLYRDLVRRAAADGTPAPNLGDAIEAVALRRRLVALNEDLQSARRSAAREKFMQRRIQYNGEARRLRDQMMETRMALFATAANQTRTSDDLEVGPR